MVRVARAGATVLPAMPAFHNRPKTIDDMVNHVVGKVFDVLGVPNDLTPRWDGPPGASSLNRPQEDASVPSETHGRAAHPESGNRHLILVMSTMSTHGISEIIAPTATIVSHFSFMIAAGASPLLLSL